MIQLETISSWISFQILSSAALFVITFNVCFSTRKVQYQVLKNFFSCNNQTELIFKRFMKTNFRAKELGSVLVDQINKPLDRAVWWIEHIMRHPTLYSGRSPVHKLTWYQYYLLDVLAFYFAITFFFGWIIFKIIFYCVCKTKKSVVNAKKTKNGNQGYKASKKNK